MWSLIFASFDSSNFVKEIQFWYMVKIYLIPNLVSIIFWINCSSPAFNTTSLWCLFFSLQTLACELEEKSAQLEMLKLLQGCEKQDQKVNNFCEWQIRSCKPWKITKNFESTKAENFSLTTSVLSYTKPVQQKLRQITA